MAAGTFTLYNGVAAYIGDGTIDLNSDTFKIMLLSSSYTPSGSHDTTSDLTGELSTANGYTAGGATLSSVTYSQTSGVATWDSADQVWTASGGSIAARYAVINDTTAGKLIGYLLLDTAPADVTATDGNTLTVGPSSGNGWFQATVNA